WPSTENANPETTATRVKPSASSANKVRRFGVWKRAAPRLNPAAASVKGEASNRYKQTKPSKPGPELTAGMQSRPNESGALRLSTRSTFEYIVYAASDFRITSTSRTVGTSNAPAMNI